MKWSWTVAVLLLPGCGWIFPMANEVDDVESYIHVEAIGEGGCTLTKRVYQADRDKQVGVNKGRDTDSGLMGIETDNGRAK